MDKGVCSKRIYEKLDCILVLWSEIKVFVGSLFFWHFSVIIIVYNM